MCVGSVCCVVCVVCVVSLNTGEDSMLQLCLSWYSPRF